MPRGFQHGRSCMRFLFTLVIFLLVLPLVFLFAFQQGLLDDYVADDEIPAEPFIIAELRQETSGADLSRRIDKALDENAYDDAVMYAEIANYIEEPLNADTAMRLEAEDAYARRLTRNTTSFAQGFVTGEGNDTPAFMGAVASDLTVIGDVRDIGSEGAKLARGEEYSKMILGLSVVGLAATTATVATGGGGLPARIGVSLLKIARKTGTITAGLTRDVTRALQEAVNFEKLGGTLRAVDLTNPQATRRAVTEYADGISMARITPILDDVAVLEKSVGPAETVRVMRYVDSADDLARVTKMSGTLGTKTRGIIEITGKTSLRAFKTAWNLLLVALEFVWAIVAGIGALFATALGRRVVRGRRQRA
ncbi:conserved hypothetical protein [Parvibaculum lavamentivorans DS-1]|uniref:Uncharacterized protein n=2 Tax=Parvibaculum lavamentivorans TaxID=256618 RepID=A7HWF7_PARL1|nr:conserved hypothetical protein [Parvibaculum lavamentivorans DS-1]